MYNINSYFEPGNCFHHSCLAATQGYIVYRKNPASSNPMTRLFLSKRTTLKNITQMQILYEQLQHLYATCETHKIQQELRNTCQIFQQNVSRGGLAHKAISYIISQCPNGLCPSETCILRSEKKMIAREILTQIRPIKSDKRYTGEKCINPCFENITYGASCTLPLSEWRIFVLTQGMMLNVGIKQRESVSSLPESYRQIYKDPALVDIKDKYGHPSISNNEAVYFAGYIAMRESELVIYLCSGRYFRKDLTAYHANILEKYLLHCLYDAYQITNFSIYDYVKDPAFESAYLKNIGWETSANKYKPRKYRIEFSQGFSKIIEIG